MSIFNIIIIGAYNYDIANDDVKDWNNPLQAKHEDLYLLQSETINIICYDVLYKYSELKDNIHYVSDFFSFDETTPLSKEAHNIIIEFCNMFDENFINRPNNQGKLMQYADYKISILACGCSWNKGFPLECVMNIIYSDNLITPCNPYSVDSFLYVISSVGCLHEKNQQEIMQPYLYGLYQTLGTLKWRGCEADGYSSENVLRELFSLVGTDVYDLCDAHQKELEDFLDGTKHWNKLSWSLREQMSEYIYGCKHN